MWEPCAGWFLVPDVYTDLGFHPGWKEPTDPSSHANRTEVGAPAGAGGVEMGVFCISPSVLSLPVQQGEGDPSHLRSWHVTTTERCTCSQFSPPPRPGAAVTNDPKLGGLGQKFILSHSEGQKSQIRVFTEPCSLPRVRPASSSFSGLQTSPQCLSLWSHGLCLCV